MKCKTLLFCFVVISFILSSCKSEAKTNTAQSNQSNNDSIELQEEISFKEIPSFGDPELFNLLYDFRDNATALKSQPKTEEGETNYKEAVEKLSQLRQRINQKINGMPEEEAFEVTKFLDKNEDNLNL